MSKQLDIEVAIPNTKRILKFGTTEDLLNWIEAEIKAWSVVFSNPSSVERLAGYVREQQNSLQTLRSNVLQADQADPQQPNSFQAAKKRIVGQFSGLRGGQWITSDHPLFPYINDFARIDADIAALVFCAARSDGNSILGHLGQGIPTSLLVRLVLRTDRAAGDGEWINSQRQELQHLKNSFETDRDAAREKLSSMLEATRKQGSDDEKAASRRRDEWKQDKANFQDEWNGLRKTYDEALALNAPALYWSDRARTHVFQALGFGALFLAVLGASVLAFTKWGIPHLTVQPVLQIPGAPLQTASPSIVLLLVPVIVPAFAVVWLLRICGRLLGESLQLMRDAKERETMVKTFLAFVHDEERGRSLLLDQDRILILHALFRPSTVSAVDDAPPVHWFDLLSSKIADKKS